MQEAIIATVSDQGMEALDRDAPQFLPLITLGGAFRVHIIRAFVAPFQELNELDTPVYVAGPSLRAYAAAHSAAANPSSGDRYPLVRFAPGHYPEHCHRVCDRRCGRPARHTAAG